MTDPELFDPDDLERGDQIVLHVDMDCFYAACERRREPELEGECVVIGMGYDAENPTGAVATASYEAREHGVESAQAISDTIERLPPKQTDGDHDGPTAYYRPVDMEYYSSVSEEVHDILQAHAETVRKVSIDEAYLDVTDRTDWESVEKYASDLKTTIADDVGVPASIGVAPSMSTAKIASDEDKPDGLVVVRPGEVEEFLSGMPVAALNGVGPVTEDRLADMGIETIDDIAATYPTELESAFGQSGITLHRRARGHDNRPVTPRGNPKSLSREQSFDPTTDIAEKQDRVRALAESVSQRVASKNVRYQTVGIKAVATPYDVQTREETLPGPIRDPAVLEEKALQLLEDFESEEIRKLGVRVSNLDFSPGEQLQFDSWTPPEAVISTESSSEDTLGPGQTKLTDFL